MRKLVYVISLTVIGAVAVSCGNNHETSKVKSVSDTVYLGMGYDTESFQSKEQCVSGEEQVEQQPQLSWNFKRVENLDAMKRDMGFAIYGEYAYGLAKFSTKASFTRNLSDTELTSTYLLSADYVGLTKILKNARMRSDIVARYNATDGKGAVRSYCGDQYVNRADVGGRLRVAVKFRFYNKVLKDGFNFSTGVGVSIPSTPASIKVGIDTSHMTENDKRNSSVEINIFQEGGNLKSLSKMLNPGAAVECNLNDWGKCQLLIESLIAYSTDSFPKDVAAGYARIFAYNTQTYFETSYPPLKKEIEVIRLATINKIELQDQDLLKANYILKSRESYIIDDRKNELERIQNLIGRNVSKLYTNLVNCVEYPDDQNRCHVLDDLQLEQYDANRLIAGSQKVVGPTMGGNGGDVEQEQVCRNYMSGVVGSSGHVLNQIGVTCDDGTVFPKTGRDLASDFNRSCPLGYVVTGLTGRWQEFQNMQVVGSLQLVCSQVDQLKQGLASPAKMIQVVFSGEKEQSYHWDCPVGFAAIGMAVKSGDLIDNVALICTNVQAVR